MYLTQFRYMVIAKKSFDYYFACIWTNYVWTCSPNQTNTEGILEIPPLIFLIPETCCQSPRVNASFIVLLISLSPLYSTDLPQFQVHIFNFPVLIALRQESSSVKPVIVGLCNRYPHMHMWLLTIYIVSSCLSFLWVWLLCEWISPFLQPNHGNPLS